MVGLPLYETVNLLRGAGLAAVTAGEGADGAGGVRRAFLDRSPGETRGVVLLDGRPERLLIVRDGDATPRLGAR